MDIQNDMEKHKFVTAVDGGDAVILYRRAADNAYDLYSTEVPHESRGRSIADQLVREAIKQAKAEKVQIIPTCPYVKRWFERHPEERTILVGSGDIDMEQFF